MFFAALYDVYTGENTKQCCSNGHGTVINMISQQQICMLSWSTQNKDYPQAPAVLPKLNSNQKQKQMLKPILKIHTSLFDIP